jgi:hypothetical protein
MLAIIQFKTFAFFSTLWKHNSYITQDYNFASGFVWLENLLPDTKGGS